MLAERNGPDDVKICSIPTIGIGVAPQGEIVGQIVFILSFTPRSGSMYYDVVIIQLRRIIGIHHITQERERGLHLALHGYEFVIITHIAHVYVVVETNEIRPPFKM